MELENQIRLLESQRKALLVEISELRKRVALSERIERMQLQQDAIIESLTQIRAGMRTIQTSVDKPHILPQLISTAQVVEMTGRSNTWLFRVMRDDESARQNNCLPLLRDIHYVSLFNVRRATKSPNLKWRTIIVQNWILFGTTPHTHELHVKFLEENKFDHNYNLPLDYVRTRNNGRNLPNEISYRPINKERRIEWERQRRN